jgi:site-specific recombinase XerD
MRNYTKTNQKGVRVWERSDGRRQIYLDIYKNGKRYYECLDLFLVPEKSNVDKLNNEAKILEAAKVRTERLKELEKGEAYYTEHAGEMLLEKWFEEYEKSMQNKSIGAQKDTKAAFAVALKYAESRTKGKGTKDDESKPKLADVDKNFILGYVDYLRNTYRKKNGQPLSESTTAQYFQYLGFAMKKAYQRGYVSENPYSRLEREDKPKDRHAKREYLEIDEVQRLIDSHCGNEQVKRAFLFSCFCGLRLSDIRNLTWGGLKTDGDSNNAIDIQKTGRRIYLTLSPDALHYLPERGAATDADKVFNLPAVSSVEDDIEVWRRRAGISKHVTFHTARHTFATMMLTLGADIYTTSKLLGHANIQTTQIYAEIIDRKKQEAVNLVKGHFTHQEERRAE